MPTPKTPLAILIVFCLIVTAPLAGQLFKLDFSSPDGENRTLAKCPGISLSIPVLKKFPHEFNAYFNDNFRFRNLLVHGNYLLHYRFLGTSPSSQVVAGQNGWLYYTADKMIDDCRGITHFSDDQLRQWTRAIALKKYWLKQQGIEYILVVAPNKCSIYPENLPNGYTKVRPETGLDQLLAYARKHTDLDLVDLRAPLIAAKGQHTLYLKTDTHWSNYGAFLAYRELLRPLAARFPAITAFSPDDFTITLKKYSAGDIAGIIGRKEFLSEEEYEFIPKRPFTAQLVEKNKGKLDPFTMVKEGALLPRALILGDSFFVKMIPFVSEHFSLSHYRGGRWNSQTAMEEIIARYKPDVVIEEVVERFIKRSSEADVFFAGIPPHFSSFLIEQALSSGRAEKIPLNTVGVYHQSEIKMTSDGLLVKTTGPDSQLLLPISKLSASGRSKGAVLRVSIESPHETKMQLFYKTGNDGTYSEDKSTSISLHKGRNQLDMLIMDYDIVSPLRLDPSDAAGQQYLIKNLVFYR